MSWSILFLFSLSHWLLKIVQASVVTNPFLVRHIFLADLKISAELDQVVRNCWPSGSEHRSVQVYRYSHHMVTKELAHRSSNKTRSNNEDLNEAIDQLLVSNVLHVYALLARATALLDEVVRDLNSSANETSGLDCNQAIVQSSLVKILAAKTDSAADWPNSEDLDRALLSLVRVQLVYQLSVRDLASGKIGSKLTQAWLTPEDLVRLGQSRLERRPPAVFNMDHPEYALAVEYLEVALDLAGSDYGKSHPYTEYVGRLLRTARENHDLHFRPPELGPGPSLYPSEAFFLRPIGDDLGRDLREEEYEHFRSRSGGKVDEHSYSRRDFFALCRGEALVLPAIKENARSQHCWLEDRNSPFLKLQPLKVEYLLDDPEMTILIGHDILSEVAMDHLRNISTEKLSPARVFMENSTDMLSTDRIQATTFLDRSDTILVPSLRHVSRLLDLLTGLQVSPGQDPPTYEGFREAEDYQVGLYGPGGLYLPHYDNLGYGNQSYSDDIYVGDRIATVMLYLSTPEGGRTAFPRLGLSFSPAQGSVLFWHNIGQNGTKLENSIHGGCPVLQGIKWVSNKWIREASQLFKRPCPQPSTSF